MDNPTQSSDTPAAAATPAPTGGAFAAVAADPNNQQTPAPIAERIPEKYRVTKDDGTLDLEASADKLLGGHSALEKRLGSGDLPPKTAEEYVPAIEGFDEADIKELQADPLYQQFAKDAHAAGFSNAQLNFAIKTFFDRNVAEAGMSNEDFRKALEPTWAADGGYEKNMASAMRVIKAYAPDATAEEIAQIPNSPLLAKVLAKVGRELGEDTPISLSPQQVGDWEGEVAKLKASEAYNNPNHAEHKQAVEKMTALFGQRYGKKERALSAGTVIRA